MEGITTMRETCMERTITMGAACMEGITNMRATCME
jgi:hypothetical protein